MKFQVGDLVKPSHANAPNSVRWELALIVGFAREIPGRHAVPEDSRLIAQILGGKLDGRRLSTWDSCLQKVEK